MLQAIRDRAQSWFAWVIVGFITIPFALWGIQEYLGTGGPQVVAEVEGVEIEADEYRNTADNYRQQQRARLAEIFGNDLNNPAVKALLDDKVIKQKALDGMIESRLLSLAAIRAGFNMSEKQIDAMIVGAPDFKRDGKFDTESYERFLRSQGMSSKGFKARITQEQISNQLIRGLAFTSMATPYEVDEQLRMKFQQREAGYMTLKAETYEHEIKIDNERIKAYYDTNIDQFKTQEQVSIEYIELSAASVAESIKIDEATLREYFSQHSDDYLVVDDAEQRKLLEDIRSRVTAGEDFAALAKQYSQDVGSAENGGDLGFMGREIMESAFENVMFALKEGEVSDIVETSFGLHLVKLEKIKGEERHVRHILINLDKEKLRSRSFEEVGDKVEQDYKQSRIDALFNDKYDLLNNHSYEHPDTLSIAAEETGLQLQSTEPFTRGGGKGIAALPAIVNTAFSANVLGEGQNSELLDLGDERVVVLRIKKHIPATPRPLDEVNDNIIKLLLKEASAERAKTIGNEILASLKDGGNPQTLAGEHNTAWQVATFYSRDSKGINPTILNELFAMPRPTGEQANYAVAALQNGDHAVVTLYSVKEGDPAVSQDADRLAEAKRITSRDASNSVRLLNKDLRAKASITIYEKNL